MGQHCVALMDPISATTLALLILLALTPPMRTSDTNTITTSPAAPSTNTTTTLPSSQSSDIYISQTGKTRDQLLADGEYFDLSAFEDADTLPTGLRTVDGYIPNAVRRREEMEHEIEGNFYMGSPLNKWPATFETNLQAMNLNPDLIKFILFTSHSPPEGEILDHKSLKSIRKSSFDPEAFLKILIHGYNETASVVRMKDAYLHQNYSHNILLVDWSPFSSNPLYYESAMSTRFVSQELSRFILFLFNRHFIPSFDTIHIVGFCMGAHIAGQTGYHIKKKAPGNQEIGRITGLDPIGAGFVYARRELCLNSEDGWVVDIIHTNGGLDFASGNLGAMDHKGSMDFYPNGGEHQIACKGSPKTIGDLVSRCAHNKAVDFYIRSIETEVFRGCPCDHWSEYVNKKCQCDTPAFMGENVRSIHRGSFYLYVYDKSLEDILGLDKRKR